MMPPALLDHVSIAVTEARPAWPLLRRALGGSWAISGTAPGFRFSTLRYANGMCLELLEPHRTDENPFVARFLSRGGPGLHHLTFKVPDLAAAVEAATAAGYPCFGVRTVDPSWHEAFIHPKVAGGTLVQLAQAGPAPLPPPPADLPPAGGATAALRVVTCPATEEARTAGLLRLLGGQVSGAGEFTFRGPGVRIRIGPARLEFTGVDAVTRVAYAGGAGIPFRDPHLGVDLVLA
ncbi:Glyoxalase/Bleomycin resistance protein/Dioxygenase superfamily protein [Asanoa hainanensis]|uniref:Glyoxalase/Bleomycin resistance protein/Dioxygenase superfamily protein n=1 Tax=Asanoa hainanensis TaxID=560556 RepID=A0A239H371_9ACTN|nr:VOC family protein [Asanoa hainanensis]SNS75632.1 Glyoxalase/Bleomycin resistance protein/Dioxygenase superfamily protein [Asanoa hainanensis]